MGKKQTRVNRGARTGGHEHRTEATAKEQTPAVRETPRPIIEQVSHKKERKFGHN
ncbi:hypothetical protein ACFC0D_16155 [Streptomyces sp. NPDC056222]|uniref:hypothetical protein n=1 Tax=Streptomyces TaxID=1883 RepID=UPI00158682DE|nr:hypothetical protein [Streptomyces vilmorinianum]